MSNYDAPDGGFMRSKKPGRPRKRQMIRFNPDRNFLKTAMSDFIKTGGKVTKLKPAGFEYHGSVRPYQSPQPFDFNITL